MSNINMNVKTKREGVYWKRVVAFIQTHGVQFTLKGVTHVDTDGQDCQCCGKRNIHNLFWVTGAADGHKEEHFIGSECQLFVLGTAGVVPANKLRTLPRAVLRDLAQRYGVKENVTRTNDQFAAEIIKARRSYANRSGHVTRRVVKAVAAPTVPAPTGN